MLGAIIAVAVLGMLVSSVLIIMSVTQIRLITEEQRAASEQLAASKTHQREMRQQCAKKKALLALEVGESFAHDTHRYTVQSIAYLVDYGLSPKIRLVLDDGEALPGWLDIEMSWSEQNALWLVSQGAKLCAFPDESNPEPLEFAGTSFVPWLWGQTCRRATVNDEPEVVQVIRFFTYHAKNDPSTALFLEQVRGEWIVGIGKKVLATELDVALV